MWTCWTDGHAKAAFELSELYAAVGLSQSKHAQRGQDCCRVRGCARQSQS
jgi:hypothetical protein